MTLTYKLDLNILPLDLHAKIQVHMSVRSARIVRRTDTHTHRQTKDVKTITPITSETWGVNIVSSGEHMPFISPVIMIQQFIFVISYAGNV